MATNNNSRTFKIFWKDQIRRFSGPDNCPWEEFLRQLRMILGPDFHQELRIQYVDDESDKIDLTTQMEWEQCLAILPPGGIVKLYITPGSGIYFKDSPPPVPQYFYEETADKKEKVQQPNEILRQVVPEVLGQCFDGNKILPYHIPDWLSKAVDIKPTHIPHEVELDVNIDGLFNALFEKAMSLMKGSKFSFAREFWLKALSIKPQHSTVLYNMACTEALLGNKRAALTYLQKAFEEGFSKVEHAASDSDLESLRSDPEFQAILSSARTQPVIKTEKEEVVEEQPIKEEPREETAMEMEVEQPAPLVTPVPVPVPIPCITVAQDPVVPEPEPQPEPQVVVKVPAHPFATQLNAIRSMGFQLEEDLLVSLLVAYDGDVSKVVSHLLAVV